MTGRLYDRRRWRRRSRAFLTRNPMCCMCQQVGKVTLAKLVDHIHPHRDDPVLFWDATNWQSLCGGTRPVQSKRAHGFTG